MKATFYYLKQISHTLFLCASFCILNDLLDIVSISFIVSLCSICLLDSPIFPFLFNMSWTRHSSQDFPHGTAQILCRWWALLHLSCPTTGELPHWCHVLDLMLLLWWAPHATRRCLKASYYLPPASCVVLAKEGRTQEHKSHKPINIAQCWAKGDKPHHVPCGSHGEMEAKVFLSFH